MVKNVKIELWQMEKLVPDGKAIRKIEQLVSRMVELIEEFGFKLPLLIRGTGEIVDGHLRLKEAQKLKLTEVPVMRCDEWSDAQVKAFRLAVNRSATWAAWDWTVVGQELAELQDMNFKAGFYRIWGNRDRAALAAVPRRGSRTVDGRRFSGT